MIEQRRLGHETHGATGCDADDDWIDQGIPVIRAQQDGLREQMTQPMPIGAELDCLAGPWKFNIASRVGDTIWKMENGRLQSNVAPANERSIDGVEGGFPND